jgi:hypothetical protein
MAESGPEKKSFKQRALGELKALSLAMLFFGCWIATLILLKVLLLAEYEISFHRWSAVLIGALILAKVILVLEHVSLGEWIRARPAWVDVVVRTALYSFGVVVVLLLERGISDRHEHGGVYPAIMASIREAQTPHVWVNSICITGALLCYNALSVIRSQLGDGALLKIFLSPLPPKQPAAEAAPSPVSRMPPSNDSGARGSNQ